MNEKLLQFIWQFRYLRLNNLYTTEGFPVKIIKQGFLNTNQGPDFLEGIIDVNNTRWVGNIELHVNSSDWFKHGHQNDVRYQNIILHVVWMDDKPVVDHHGNTIPTLVLNGLVARTLLDKYQQLIQSADLLPCKNWLPSISELVWASWKERLAVERINQKASYLLEKINTTNGNWEWVLWQMVARVFGGKVNGPVFELVIQSIPWGVMQRCSHQPIQLEALLMGQAGLLDGDFKGTYPQSLQKEYSFLQKKYALKQLKQQVAFLRMRPAGFPTIRFSQLVALILQHPHLAEKIKSTSDHLHLMKLFHVNVQPYWCNHYQFDDEETFIEKHSGKELQQSIVINAIVPFLYAYGISRNHSHYIDRAIKLLYHLPAEQNKLLRKWQELPVTNNCALHSQALIQLQQFFCEKKACLTCAIGNGILK